MGQHLLIDPNIQRKIVDLLLLRAGEAVLEIGPGLGALTGELLRRKVSVLALEKDPKFVEVLREELGVYSKKLKLIREDILKCSLNGLVRQYIPKSKQPLKVVSNLPYYITAPILFRLIACRELFSEAVLMMQKEVAARILAEPGSKDYGRLSLMVRFFAHPRHAFDVSTHCFTPRPGVSSSVMVLRFHAKLSEYREVNEEFLAELVRLAFGQRRKVLLTVLRNYKPFAKSRAELSAVFEKAKIPLMARPEELLPKDYLALAAALRS